MMENNRNHNILSEDTKKVLKPREWDTLDYKSPYILEILKNKGQALTYIGVDHTKNPKDKQLKKIEELFEQTKKSNLVGLIEYPPDLIKSIKNKETAIKEYGEAGLVKYLADKSGISDIICPEPTFEEIINSKPLKKFKKEDILTWAITNALVYSSKKNKDAAVKSILETTNSLKNAFEKENPVSIFREKIKEITDLDITSNSLENISEEKIKKIKQIQDPFLKNNRSIINNIGEEINWVRDRYIATNILKLLKKDNNIFAVYGANHVVAQEPVLK